MDPDVNINKWNRLALVQAKSHFIRKVFHSASPDKCFLKYSIAIFMVGKMRFLVLLGFTTTFHGSFSCLHLEKEKTVVHALKSIDKSSQKENLTEIPLKEVLFKRNYITNKKPWDSNSKNQHNSYKINKLPQGVWHLLSLMRQNS